ncbi:hypothetical protein BOTBODRAFT_34597 [Botryobasidium botryosum FD-172 SS1]|uniref:Uncharacterized protein n=1 Tax=Botryobasidium botryosum (strain FD-172 SS1) TaxID=930990 RepID=A0A067MCC5_BOTB1|nr:hypothetical protein BOTBODRAFT_34597 [Botryobasidium botryosum FD-172 SS1]
MGSSSSKVARKLPTRAKPTWAGSRTNIEAGTAEGRPAPPLRAPLPEASETRSDAIERDAKDPHFMANLSRIGQVNVPNPAAAVRTANHMKHVLSTLQASEEEAASLSPIQNRLHASSLSELLDERKSITSTRELADLAKRYGIDVEVLEGVAKYVNSPSVGESGTTRTVDEQGEEKITMQATWVDPILDNEHKRIGSTR